MKLNYFEEMQKAMNLLAKKEDTIFIGQSVGVAGTAMRNTLLDIHQSKLIEFPVEEDMQMGVSIGMSLAGKVPISIFPRWNFLLLATNQIVNHLDKLKDLTDKSDPGKVIIRTGIGSVNPLHPGPQHTGDFTDAFKILCPNLNIVRLDNANQIVDEYLYAYEREDGVSSLIIEWSDKYND